MCLYNIYWIYITVYSSLNKEYHLYLGNFIIFYKFKKIYNFMTNYLEKLVRNHEGVLLFICKCVI